jgi:hypothetical protein
MAALTAAPELSEGNWTDRFERVTVHQRGWCLGGKGACSRLDEAAFVGHAKADKVGCPVSRALAGVPEITLDTCVTRLSQ